MSQYLALTSSGLENLLADELEQLGATEVVPKVQSVQFSADFTIAQKIVLWTRLATRILRLITSIRNSGKDDIYNGVLAIDWQPYFAKSKTFAVDFVGTDKSIRNTQFGALIVKDAVVDNLREELGKRPDINKENPDLRIQARLFKGICHIYLDFSGPSLHQRGYRLVQGSAPIKEHLAAAIIMRSGWDKTSPFVDLFAGSGTLLIEACSMHQNIAPGLNKSDFPFERYPEFNQEKFDEITSDVKSMQTPCSTQFIGFEINHVMVEKAQQNVANAGFSEYVKIGQQDAGHAQVAKHVQPGWIVSNPPYGERIGDSIALLSLFKQLGLNLKQNFMHWHLSLITGQPLLLKLLRLRKSKEFKLKNGPIDALLVNYELTEQQCELSEGAESGAYYISKDGQAFDNRLDKNIKRLNKWAKKNDITAYRIYDADIPEYNVAVDYYDGKIVVYEYQAPKSINESQAEIRLLDALSILQSKFNLDSNGFSLKVRKSQKGKQQYEKEDNKYHRFTVGEYGAQFYVNIHDYLDTGLFLDHRETRKLFSTWCHGKSVLNLFCYTGSLSVHAALAGAEKVTSVDMSNTYINWAQDNFKLNGIERRDHDFVRADCLEWLTRTNQKFDMVFLDPPSFSNSKRMDRTWDVQRDHVEILKLVKERLTDQGIVLFSNNLRNFKLDEEGLGELGFSIKNITDATLPEDFKRNKKIHHCWKLECRN
jgi:23S rRNA (guanine2445-N2)-methyltransferase / 23S rRNA (guanine2069-N7)-methyltransferase